MENMEGIETLDKGLVGLRECQGGGGIPNGADSVLLCTLDCKCASDAHSGLSEVKNVELGEDLGNGSVGESVVGCSYGNDQINFKDGDVSAGEGDLVFNVSGFQIEKADEVIGKNDDAWHSGDWEFDVGGVLTGKVEESEATGKNDDAWHPGDLTVNTGDGIQLNNVDEPEGKDDGTWHSHELVQDKEGEDRDTKYDDLLHHQVPGSLLKMEGSGNGINLFVEVFGPLDGISESNNHPSDKDEHISEDGDSSNERPSNENGTLSSCLETASSRNEVEDTIVGKQECRFDIGDLVWAKTRTQLWWPGIISACSNAAGDKTNTEKEGTFHVKYYGNGNSVWCSDSEMKPFAKYFDQLSGQNNSRNFYGSVEKALCEYGQRIKFKMTCRCFFKDNQTRDVRLLLEKKQEKDVLLLSKFEPASFSAHIRQLARSALLPGKIDLIAIKNSLSAFYYSTGHYQLPLQQLRLGGDAAQNAQDAMKPEVMDESYDSISGQHSKSVNDDHHVLRSGKRNRIDAATEVPDDKASLSVKCPESRERKKSKYLSYPYVDVNKGLNAKSTVQEESQDHSSVTTKSTPHGKSGGKTSQKRGLRKLSKESDVVGEATIIYASPSALLAAAASPANFLAELCNTARNCFYNHGSKQSDSLKGFCCGFRKFAFLVAGEACKVVRCQQEPDGKKLLPQNSSEAVVLTEETKVVKVSKKQKIKLATVKGTAVENQASAANCSQEKQGKYNKTKKKKEQVTSAGLQSTAGEVVTEGVKVARASKKKRVNCASLKETVDDGVDNLLSVAKDQQTKENGKCRRPKKKKEPVKSDGGQPTEGEVLAVGVEETEASAKPSEDHTSREDTADKAEGNQIPEANGLQPKGKGKRRAAKKKKEHVKSSGLQSAQLEVVIGAQVVKASGNPMVDNVVLEGTVGNSVGNGLQVKGNVKQKAGKKKKELVVTAGLQFTNSCAVTRTENNLNSSRAIVFQNLFPDKSKSLMAHKKQEGLNNVLPQINATAQLPDLNGSQRSDVVEQIPSGLPSVNPGNPLPGTGREELVSPRTSIVDQTAFTTISTLNLSVINLQILPQSNSGASSTNHNLNADFAARGMEPGEPHIGIISFPQPSLPVGLSPSAGNSERKERKRKQKTQQAASASAIPDLNGNVLDACASGNPLSPENVSSQKRKRTIEEDPGASLTLNFASGSNVPSKETLVAKFSRYGLLKESEIQFFEDSSLEIAYARTSDARFAFRSMEKSNPFGEELTSFKLNCAVTPMMNKQKRNNQQSSHPVVDTPRIPATARSVETPNIGLMRKNVVDNPGPRNPATPRAGEMPDIGRMRQNVEMMKMTLEKDGSNLAPEIRAKLEHEINVFLDKINTLGSSSSTPTGAS